MSCLGLPDKTTQQRYKKEDIVLLLQQGADINEQDISGYTALWRVCRDNRTDIIEILLQNNKINVNLQNTSGESPFYRACEARGNYECTLIMLQDARVDVNMADTRGISPLMTACYGGKTEIVQLLISSGRYIDILKKSTKDFSEGIKSGSTALDVAKQRNSTDIVRLLEQYQNNPKETQKTTRNELNLQGKK